MEGGHAQSKQIAKSGFFRMHLMDLPLARTKLKADLYHGVYWMRPWEKGPYVLTVHDISFAVHPEWFRPGEAMFYTKMVRRAAERARKGDYGVGVLSGRDDGEMGFAGGSGGGDL